MKSYSEGKNLFVIEKQLVGKRATICKTYLVLLEIKSPGVAAGAIF